MAKQSSLRKYVSNNYLVLFIIFALLLVAAAGLVLSFILWDDLLYLKFIFGGVVLVLVVLILVFYIYFSERTYKLFYETLYKNTQKNLEAIKDSQVDTAEIKDSSMEEFQEVNELFSDISNQVKNRVVVTTNANYESLHLDYEDEELGIVKYESLAQSLTNLIILTKSYRNALCELFYEIEDDGLEEKDYKKILNEIKKVIKYDNLLISKNKHRNGFLLYITVFDNVNQLEEELSSIFRHISIVKRSSEGKKIVPARCAVVIYPYSAPEAMLSDLVLAKKGGKAINVYTPSKENRENTSLLYETVNFNEINKASERLDLLDSSSEDGEKEIERVINDLANYFSFTCAGFAELNKVKKQYLVRYSYSKDERHLVNIGSNISNKFMEKLVLSKDNDNSYYFSNRKHVNDALAAFIDAHNLKSGLFYVIMQEGECVGVTYFVNDDKDMEFDISIKQGLIGICNKIGSYLKSFEVTHIANINAKRFQEILKLNNDILYSVNPDDHTLFFLSAAMKSICPKANEGEKCYQALYGLDAPCKACPLKTKKHMVEILKRRKFETSVVLHSSNDKAEHLFLKPMEKNKSTSDLFSPEFLVNSYYSFCATLEDEFVLEQDGEVVFMNIDNVPEIIKKFGNDGYVKLMREFFDKLKEELDLNYSIYLYKNDNFAIMLPVTERDQVISMVESIYRYSKDIPLSGKVADINISYYDFKYPSGKANSKEFINYAEKVMTGIRRGKKTDSLYFNEDKYVRSASRDAFMLNNVLEAFKKKKYFMEYQPIVGNKDRTIHGIECLMRLRDPFSNQPINIGEAINIVARNNRIDLVSSAMRDCIDALFEKSDLPFFKSMGLEHMSVNADYQTLSDDTFVMSFIDLEKKHNVPRDFIRVEVTEQDLSDHFEDYRSINIANGSLVCDQYTGELLTLDQLKALNVKEVKLSRDVILNVINDDVALDKAHAIWKAANELDIEVTFVGVEKRQQADLLHDDVLDSGFQGRFFYSPLDEEKLFKVLRENSIKEIADLDM